MRLATRTQLLTLALVCLAVVVHVWADEPIFVRWLDDSDPGDRAILVYWERMGRGELGPVEMVDLGTMLFERGYPKDAVRMFRAALDADENMYEAWFRIGLVEHREGNLRAARKAYRKCLKLLTGHGWCNFYMGLLEEQTGHASRAIDYYRRAFKFAPELADPEVNPEILYSELEIGALLMQRERERFGDAVPMPFLEPDGVAKARRGTPDRSRDQAGVRTAPPTAPAEPAEDDQAAPTAAPPVAGSVNLVPTTSGTRPQPSTGTRAPKDAGEGPQSSVHRVPRNAHEKPSAQGPVAAPTVGNVSPEASLLAPWTAPREIG